MLTPPEPDASFEQLRERLATSTQELEQVYWLDILGIRHSLQQEYLEALEYLVRAVAIRSRVAQLHPDSSDRLAATLSNQGRALFALARYDEAVAAHAHALDLYGHLLDRPECLSRYVDIAELLAEALHSRGCDALAARFQGRAVAAFQAGLPIAGGSEDGRVLAVIGRLGALLDADGGHGPGSGCATCQDEGLLALSRPSVYTATALGDLTSRAHLENPDAFAVRCASRTVAYCDLFDSTIFSTRPDVFVVHVDNLLAIGKWSIALGGGDAAIRAVRRAIALCERHPFWLLDHGKLAMCHYVAGVLQAPKALDAASQDLAAAVQRYEELLSSDPAKYTPRLAETLHGLAIVFAATGQKDESAAASLRSSAMWTQIGGSPEDFDIDAIGARQRLQFLSAAAANASASPASMDADIDAMLAPVLDADRRRGGEIDRRMWSCTGRNFVRMIADLAGRGILSSDVHTLGSRLRLLQLYPARDVAYRCQAEPPDLFLSYNWSTNFVDLQAALYQALQYLAGIIGQARPDLAPDDIQRLVLDHIRIWVDFVFIDQSARDVVAEVREIVPAVIKTSAVHLVLSPTALTRSWCCYELALFNERDATEESGQRTMRSLVEPPTTQYTTFASTSTTVAKEKATIEQYLVENYPGGLHALDALLVQSSMLSDPFVVKGFAQFGEAERMVLSALPEWLDRMKAE